MDELQRVEIHPQRHRHRLDAHGATVRDDELEDLSVIRPEPALIDRELLRHLARVLLLDPRASGDLRLVASPLEEPEGLPRNSPRPAGDRRRGLRADRGPQPRRCAPQYLGELLSRVELEPLL